MRWILSRFIDPSMCSSILEDLAYRYEQDRKRREKLTAAFRSTFRCIVIILPLLMENILGGLVMLKSYLKIALRHIKRYKGYSLINITGLALGMASCLLIFLWIQEELSYDRFHENARDIYRVLLISQEKGYRIPQGPGPLAVALKEEIPEIKNSARMMQTVRRPLKFEDKNFHVNVCGVEQSFMEIFTFPFMEGDGEASFSDPNFIILTEETAKKYFGDENPIGRTMQFEWWSRWLEFHVTGIVKDVPSNSHLQFDALIPFSFVKASGMSIDDWDVICYHSYVQLEENADLETVNRKIAGTLKRHYKDAVADIGLEPMLNIHLYDYSSGGPIVYVYIFGTIGIFILIIACMNYMNLSTARSLNRAREVGVRKMVGSRRIQLIQQFLGESVLLALLASTVAVFLTRLFLPTMNRLLDTNLALHHSGMLVLSLMGIAVITGILSGMYPAFFLSSFRPVTVLKGNAKSGARNPFFRKALVITQFTISILLIICSVAVYRQLSYIKNRELGFEKNHIINFQMGGSFYDKYDPIKQELLQHPNILSVERTNFSFPGGFAASHVSWEGKQDDENVTLSIRSVDFDFQKTFDIEVVQGRFFSKDYPTDVWHSFILNEAAVNFMGLESPIGKQLSCDLPHAEGKGTIIGVVKDFHFQSLHHKIEPLILVVHPWWYTDAYIRIRPEKVPGTLAFIEDKLKEFVPEFPFELHFLDEEVDRLYQTEQRAGVLVRYGTFLALFIACLGLLGLVSFTAEKRTKEIGIRKALGASVPGIIRMLTMEFAKWVMMANIIAWPMAYFVMNKFLQNYAYRINLGIEIFIISGLVAFGMALFTVSYQSIKAATANPVDSLRYE
jgi:putative ABC transport system permease protein